MDDDSETTTIGVYGVDATLQIEKSVIESVSKEFDSQLRNQKLVNMKFLHAARRTGRKLRRAHSAASIETRGNIATYH